MLAKHGYKSLLTAMGLVCLFGAGASGEIYAARARHHRGPTQRVARHVVRDGDHAHEIEIYRPERSLDASARESGMPGGAASVAAHVEYLPQLVWEREFVLPLLQFPPGSIDASPGDARGPPSFL